MSALGGPGTWDKLMRGVEVARRAGLDFSTVMTISSLNYLDAAGSVEPAERLGADGACMIPTIPVGGPARISRQAQAS
jgi:MoaA/NifB/PqqE/SkfB family radical SAM enzyme